MPRHGAPRSVGELLCRLAVYNTIVLIYEICGLKINLIYQNGNTLPTRSAISPPITPKYIFPALFEATAFATIPPAIIAIQVAVEVVLM